MTCHTCKLAAKKFGKDRKGNQRYRCAQCRKTFQAAQRIEGKYLPLDKALLCLNMLVEGSSVRAIERITGVHRDTVLDLMVRVDAKCEQLMRDIIKDVPVKDVQADELWAYVGCKEKRKTNDDPRRGDATVSCL